jgi:DNA-binding NarL/FixJ family response regulator
VHIPSSTTIVIADDHPLFRGALRQAVNAFFPKSRVIESSGLEDLVTTLGREGYVDLILLDLNMPGVQGFSGLLFLRSSHPETPVVIVSANDESSIIRRAIEFGASGFIPKSSGVEVMGAAITSVLKGNIWVPHDVDLSAPENPDNTEIVKRLGTLTPQQMRVLMMLSEGLLNKQIAFELNVSEPTVKAHVSAILQKLAVESRTQAVIAASKISLGTHQNDGH